MFDKFDGPTRIVLSLLLFPALFQAQWIDWVWGAHDEFYISWSKRVFLLLPVSAVLISLWASIAALVTVIIRQNRRQYVSALFVTWWDLARAIFSFWGGFFRFAFLMVGWMFAFLRVGIFGLWISIQDIVLTPWRALSGVSNAATQAGTPWIAVWMTLLWCALEALIFTFILTNMVSDLIASQTGVELEVFVIQIVLFFMLLAFVTGSYAIVANLEAAIRSRNIKMILTVVVVEALALVVEVPIFYREFVDALIQGYRQQMGSDFELGFFGIMAMSCMMWAGIRGLTWFLFASHGTPTIMAIIQRTGLGSSRGSPLSFKKEDHFKFIQDALNKIKRDIDWVHSKGDEIVSAFVLPPMQIVAATVNFLTMLVSSRHLFQLPFKSYKDMLHADQLLSRIKEKS
jgi:hypothetical protein